MPRGWFKEPKRHSKASKLGWQRRKTGLPPLYFEDLRRLHQQRNLRARMRDERLRAKNTIEKQEVYEGIDSYNAHSWAEQPGRKDIEEIDTPPTTKLGTTEVKTKAEPKMEWYQPKLLPDGTYLAQTRDKRMKYTYKISWGISNPYHLKVYYEGHLFYENKFKTKAEMRDALEEQLILMKRIDTPTEPQGHEYYMSKTKQQTFKNKFYNQMNVERRNDKDSLFPMYNALHNYIIAKSTDFKGSPQYKRDKRIRELQSGYKDAKRVGREEEAEELIEEYNDLYSDTITLEA